MTDATARIQFGDVLGVIREHLNIVEDICNEQLDCPVKIEIASKGQLEAHKETWTGSITVSIHSEAQD